MVGSEYHPNYRKLRRDRINKRCNLTMSNLISFESINKKSKNRITEYSNSDRWGGMHRRGVFHN